MNISDKDTYVKVINKFNGRVGYDVPDLGIHRDFFPKEQKNISLEQLTRLSYTPGGQVILREYLEITDKKIATSLLHYEPEPEYYYSAKDVINLMKNGTLEQFLDCLDFAPEVIKDIIKEEAVKLPLNDVAKREAIREKLNFDVSRAIEIKNTKSQEEIQINNNKQQENVNNGRRTIKPTINKPQPTGRRYIPSDKSISDKK